MRNRQRQRYTKRLEITFTAGGLSHRGITSDISPKGLFLRTQHGLVPGSILEIEIFLPDHTSAHATGVVRRTIKSPFSSEKNGMGIEFIEKDENFAAFLEASGITAGQHPGETSLPAPGEGDRPRTEKEIVPPPVTEMKPQEMSVPAPPRPTNAETAVGAESVTLPCPLCGAENSFPQDLFTHKPRCGRCGVPIDAEDIARHLS